MNGNSGPWEMDDVIESGHDTGSHGVDWGNEHNALGMIADALFKAIMAAADQAGDSFFEFDYALDYCEFNFDG